MSAKAVIRGYLDRPSARAGEMLDLYVDTREAGDFRASIVRLFHGDTAPEGPGYREAAVDSFEPIVARGKPQRTQIGGHILIDDGAAQLTGREGLEISVLIWPTLPGKRQGIISRWCKAQQAGWALSVEDGLVHLDIGDGTSTARVSTTKILQPEVWVHVTASLDAATGVLRIAQQSVVNRVNSRISKIVPYDADCETSVNTSVRPVTATAMIVIGGIGSSLDRGRQWVECCFNGKIEAPRVTCIRTADGAPPVEARWDFAVEIGADGVASDRVTDVSGGFHGKCINQPDRGMTGSLWQGREERFIHAPAEYAAIWFHEDSLDDCRWDDPITLPLPAELRSAVYAVVVEKDGFIDRLPFFVAPATQARSAKLAVVLPTYSYMAYANSQVMQNAAGGQAVMGVLTTLDDRDIELNCNPGFGLSTYDYHLDGRGVQYSTWRRPILNMRPDYRHEFGTIWQFPADLHLIDWLDVIGIEVDVLTDHDLAVGGLDLLRPYKAVIQPSHPEYCSWNNLNAYEDYVAGGGRMLYLGGNGFYWVTSQDRNKPWLIEVRKGESGDQAWRARPGEMYHSTDGERGGLWRNRSRAPQKLWGIGYTAHCLEKSAPYTLMPDTASPDLQWLMEGIAPNEPIGNFGLVNGGAAGLEVDRIDYALGTPPGAALIACSYGHSANAILVPEEQYFAYPGLSGLENPLVRADIIYFDAVMGGAVFSVGSMAWCGSLSYNNYDNNVSRMTQNVILRFCEN